KEARRVPTRPATPAPARPPAPTALLDLQRTWGNRAVGSLLQPGVVQRDVGWAGSTGWNKGKRTIDATHKMVRLPLSGLGRGNTAPPPNPAKTDELADARAIVWVHPDLDPKKPIDVVVHLHGLTSRPDDPFPGWRENKADPTTNESDASKA